MKNQYMEELLNDPKYIYYAHTKEDSNEKELLSSHLNLTYNYYLKMEKYKNLDKKVKDIINKTFKIDDKLSNIIYEMYKSAIYYHDIGKINPNFQKNKMQNNLNIKTESTDDTHSALSARIYIDCTQREIFENKNITDIKQQTILLYVSYYFGYIISRHHTQLEGIENLFDTIKEKNIPQMYMSRDKIYEKQLNYMKSCFIEQIQPDPISMYILCKLLYSSIITADFYATYDYMSGDSAQIDILRNEGLFRKYEKSELFKNIEKYNIRKLQVEGINKLRNEMFLETQRNLIKNMDKDIFYIEAPTGSGKTNTAINIARILYQKNENIKSIHYIFPFNTIIEQTANTFDNYFEKYKDYSVMNSITSMVKDINEYLNYEQAYMKNAFKQYPIILTSHINLFNTLFGTGKEINYGLYHLIDSVIILDEIQAYSNNIWREMIEMFSKYSDLLNIKFVIMSATLPRLDKLLNQTITKFQPLIIDTKKYYKSKIFKNRVILNFDLLDKKIDVQILIQHILKHKGKKILVEFIKKDTADNVYEQLKQMNENVYELTGDDNAYTRKEIIKKVKKEENIILIATQTIEAGVDIDMDIGFKDISFLDNEEQFIGRINRSNKKKGCIAYFFNLDDARNIYKSDNRLEYNLEKKEVQEWFKNKEFNKFYERIMLKVYEKTEEYTNKNINNFYNYCAWINYKKVESNMKLINSDTIQLFLNYTVKIDNETIIGKDIFEKYKKICKDKNLGYAERKIKLSNLSEKLNLFIYAVYKNKINTIKGEQFGELYYIDNGYEYMKDGKFNRKQYLDEGDGLFL